MLAGLHNDYKIEVEKEEVKVHVSNRYKVSN